MTLFFPSFFLCIYTCVKVKAIKLYSSDTTSCLEAQERSRLTRQSVISKVGC